ncbi:PP2C family protein-serine/threonine phosphatase [Fodinicola acaciae]|uniref:PP2C family protein-serine/threonine phosphatase n=1 Tax=Fodinicola acaciae TaxID=2681555 RepID=UPI0013CFA2E9|nr:protein phosphatase 2C domain-containing protein [Fodinicola acaciae]
MPRLTSAAATHPGLVRAANEDAFHEGTYVLAVADGVGGLSAGDRASRLAVGALTALDEPRPYEQIEPLLRAAVETANQQIAEQLNADPAIGSAGTTLTALVFSDDHRALLAHVGDSRCYRLRAGQVDQLTTDDTFVQMLVELGAISAEQAHDHPQRSIVTRVLRGEPVEVYYAELLTEPSDRYLLCSDGLPAAAADDRIAAILTAEPDATRCADQLIEAALAGGGPDNVTVVVVDCAPLSD